MFHAYLKCCFWCSAYVFPALWSEPLLMLWRCLPLRVFRFNSFSLCVFLPRLAESRTNPQMLDIGVNPQDYNPEECLSPSNWDKAEAEAADAEDAFGFWSAVLERARCASHRRPLAAEADSAAGFDLTSGPANPMRWLQRKHSHRPKQYPPELSSSILTFKVVCYFP